MLDVKNNLNESRQKRHGSDVAGFSLIELMVTVAIAAILLAIAVPQFKREIEQSQFTNASNELLGVMNYARAEALRRARPVTVAAISAPPTVPPTIPPPDPNWNLGWQMFLDVNRNGAIDDAAVIRQGDPTTAAQLTSVTAFVTFDSNGRRWSNAADPFVEISSFKTGAAADLERTVCVGRGGRSIIAKGAFPCG